MQALEGLIQALVNQDKMKVAIPLMEQLYQSGGESPNLLLNLAQSLSKAGELKKSSYYYQELINKYRVSHEVIHQAASIYEQLEEIDAAAVLWDRYLNEAPESLYLRQKLAEYYLTREKYQEALPHLIILLDHNVNREEYLLQTGKIYLLTLGRADKALGYYESYANEFPQGENVSSEIENIRLILANNLLSIVENDGVWMLWTDLAKITPDRVGIYRAMADVLEGLGYKVLTATDGLQAIEVYQRYQSEIDLVVLDVVMPRLGGPDALHAIKEINPDVKAMYATGYDKLSTLGLRKKKITEQIISKPFEIHKLSQMIDSALNAGND